MPFCSRACIGLLLLCLEMNKSQLLSCIAGVCTGISFDKETSSYFCMRRTSKICDVTSDNVIDPMTS